MIEDKNSELKIWTKPEIVEVDGGMDSVEQMTGPSVDFTATRSES